MKNSFELVSPAETGRFGVCHLKRFWQRAKFERGGHNLPRLDNEWMLDKIVLYGLNLALEETIQYLNRIAPTFEEFENWILEINDGRIDPLQIERINAAVTGAEYSPALKRELIEIEESAPVLSADALEFWDKNGYVIVREAISKKEAAEAAEAVRAELGVDPGDPETWYRRPAAQGIMVQSFHRETFRRNRRAPRIRKAFAQIWKTSDLWTTIDRVGFNPPERPHEWEFPGPRLHWDMSLEFPLYFGTQGILYLVDVSAEQGAFSCVPGFHRKIEDWLKNLPPGTDPREQALRELSAKPIAAGAGDLIIWHQALPHGASPNRTGRPRIVQYINMFPNGRDDNDLWK